MSIAIDWFASTSSQKWQQANSVSFKVKGPSFFDYLYIHRIDNHKATNIALGILATLLSLSIFCALLYLHPSFAVFFKGMHIGGPCFVAFYLLLLTLPGYVKYRLYAVEKANAPYYKALDDRHEKFKLNPPPLSRGQILYNAYTKI